MFHGYFISDFWWIFPLLMIIMCFFMMSRGCFGCMMGKHMSGDKEKRTQADSGESAFNILNKRYASGEIDRNEYEAKKSDIRRPEG